MPNESESDSESDAFGALMSLSRCVNSIEKHCFISGNRRSFQAGTQEEHNTLHSSEGRW
jgi:hypothetical protein